MVLHSVIIQYQFPRREFPSLFYVPFLATAPLSRWSACRALGSAVIGPYGLGLIPFESQLFAAIAATF